MYILHQVFVFDALRETWAIKNIILTPLFHHLPLTHPEYYFQLCEFFSEEQ